MLECFKAKGITKDKQQQGIKKNQKGNVTRKSEMTKKLHEQTVTDEDAEVKNGWVRGPFSEQDLILKHGPPFLSCRRFGVEQGLEEDGSQQIRPTDDFGEYFHNSCVTMIDNIGVSGVDGIADLIKLWAGCIAMAK